MQSDWIWGLAGGGIIGAAGAIFLLANGRIMGASGILGRIVDRSAGESRGELIAFVLGLFAAPALIALLVGGMQTHITNSLGVIVTSGILVGVGTRTASGCTSGHGVCGISRFSLRGIVATVAYILAGGATVFLFRHAWGMI